MNSIIDGSFKDLIDEDATQKRVERFFSKQGNWDVINMRAQVMTIQSPKFDDDGSKSTAHANSQEQQMVTHADAKMMRDFIIGVIKSLDTAQRAYIKGVLLDGLSYEDASQTFAIGKNTISRHKKEACLNFAICFEGFDYGETFVIYKDEQKGATLAM